MGNSGFLFDMPEPLLPDDVQRAELRELIGQYRVKMNQLTGRLMYLERTYRKASDLSAQVVCGFVDSFLADCATVPDSPAEWQGDKCFTSDEVYAFVIEMYQSARDLRRIAKKIVTTRRHFYRDLQILRKRHGRGESAFDRDANLRLQERRQWTQKEREKIWIQSERMCRYCKTILESCSGDIMHVDHIVPVVAGGSDDLDNLAAACVSCNLAKNAKSEDSFLALLLASGKDDRQASLFDDTGKQ